MPTDDRMASAATVERDADVEIVLRWVIGGREPTTQEWEQVPELAALARIEQRLAAGAAMAAVVDECVKAGHIKAVTS